MRVLVYGGRTYRNKKRLFAELDAIHRETPIHVIIHGGATGADSLGKWWGQQNGVPDEPYEADWDDLQAETVVARRRPDGSFYNAVAGCIRNEKMMREGKPDIVIEFKGGSGTQNMRYIVKREMKRRPLRYIQISERWKLVRIQAPHFTAGFETDGALVKRTAPILRYMLGWTETRARTYIAKQGWKAIIADQERERGDGGRSNGIPQSDCDRYQNEQERDHETGAETVRATTHANDRNASGRT